MLEAGAGEAVELQHPDQLAGGLERLSDVPRTQEYIRYAVGMDCGAGLWVARLRARHGLSQGQLAYRASSSQQQISRIERGVVSPSIGLLERLAVACGEELVLDTRARKVPFEDAQLAEQAALSMAERLQLASSWNRLAGEMTGVAARALLHG
ncbi:MAG: helix-turn-helix transcriptional regulator [Solirubrobacteraceae bacterium]